MSDEHPYHSLQQPISNRCDQSSGGSLEDTLPSHAQVEQSKRLPRWLWSVLCYMLGISHRAETQATLSRHRKVASTLLYGITLVLGLLYLSTFCWYKVYDIKSTETKSTVVTGLVEIVICVAWCALGIYANNLASRLFNNQKFVDSVRSRTKTVLKLSAAFIMVALGMTFFAVRFYQDYMGRYREQVCEEIKLNVLVCRLEYISQVCFSVFALIWNLMVGLILLSVCRTHTVGIRRFIRHLDADAKLYERFCREKMISGSSVLQASLSAGHTFHAESILNETDWYIWDDDESFEAGVTSTQAHLHPGMTSMDAGTRPSLTSMDAVTRPSLTSMDAITRPSLTSMDDCDYSTELLTPIQNCDVKPEGASATPYCCSAVPADPDPPPLLASSAEPPTLLSNSDILLYYWMILYRLRMTSWALQRWLASWICVVFIWCANYVIYWISHEATLLGIAEFMLPLLLLPLVCSAYAETNNDGLRMIRCIFPTEKRMSLLHYLNNQPLQMTVFNFPVTFSAILGVIVAFAVAFASRMIMDQVIKT